MLDYKQLEALATVVDEGGFDKAAGKLHITQSAVSQRIRSLEDSMGQALLVRSTPIRTTSAGQRLLAHYRKVHHLETDMLADSMHSDSGSTPIIALAVNEDSLATWFLPTLLPFLNQHAVLLDLYTDDQDQTHTLLREGTVAGCISTRPDPIQGCTCVYLGRMEYHCLCTPAFRERWFSGGVHADAIRKAPAVTFNRKDMLHCRFAASWDVHEDEFPTHYIPSSEGFVALIRAGLAYGMVPHPQGARLVEQGILCDLAPEKAISIHLYWHHWNLGTALLAQLSEALTAGDNPLLA